MIKNQPGFIPEQYGLKPQRYRRMFDGWVAVFITESRLNPSESDEYHLRLTPSVSGSFEDTAGVEVLKWVPPGWRKVAEGSGAYGEFSSIEKAVAALQRVLEERGEVLKMERELPQGRMSRDAGL